MADLTRQRRVGDDVTFAASYYMNYTNVCAASCQMCAFYRKKGDDDAYTLTPDQIEQRVATAMQMGATEVHIVGGFHPSLPLEYYEEMMRAIKSRHPDLNIKAFTARRDILPIQALQDACAPHTGAAPGRRPGHDARGRSGASFTPTYAAA